MNDFLALEYFIDPNKRVYFLYIFSSIILAIGYLAFYKKETKINLSSKLWLHPSAKLDYYYFFLSYFIKIFMLFPIVISAKTIALMVNKQFYFTFDFYEDRYFSYPTILLMYTVALFLVSDFTRYWLHRFLHTVPFLWHFHKVHHSAKVLTAMTFYRVHPIENLLFGFRYSLSIGLVTGVFIYFFGAKIDIYDILGVNIIVFVFCIFGSNLRHSHIALSYGKFLEKIFISPKQHQIHHSKKHFNRNFGGYLAIWDLFFGTLKLSNEVKVLKFGLKKEQMSNYGSIKDLIFRPFIDLKINFIEKMRGKVYE